MKKFCFALLFGLLLLLSVSAKSTVIYRNDFSQADLSDFFQYGNFVVEDGKLRNYAGRGPSAYVTYTLPAAYAGKNYQVDVDMMNSGVMGGILIGGDGEDLAPSPSYFFGYTCTLSGKTNHPCIAYFNRDGGWGGTFAPGTPVMPEGLLHLMVRIEDGVMTFRVSDAETGEQYYGVRYEIGVHTSDIYNRFTDTVGLRRYYDADGYFDNFTVTVLEDDALPAMTASALLGGLSAKQSGLSAVDGTLTGFGAILSDAPLTGNYRIRASLAAAGTSRLYFGMQDAKNGYAVTFRTAEEDIVLSEIRDGRFTELGKRRALLRSGYCDLTLDAADGVVSVRYDNLFQGDDAFPYFTVNLPDTDGRFGFWLEGGSLTEVRVGDAALPGAGETYQNPVSFGADPDVLYHDGTYYLYNSVNNGSDIFRVYTSPDLAHFTPRNVVFKNYRGSGVDLSTAWSPNVFYHDGLFYLFFAAKKSSLEKDSDRHVYYATSDSPYGPFTHEGPLVAVNPDIREIDGHPFRDEDGKLYMSFSRYDRGGTVWLQEVTMQDGVVKPVPGREARVIVADEEYDTDGGVRLCEGGVVWKHNGLYYIVYATTSYARHYGEAYAVADNIFGPYKKYRYNPVLVYNFELDGPGDALIVPSPDGSELYFVYHRHYTVGKVSPRQTCIDRIRCVPDPDGGPDILTVRGPSNTPMPLPANRYRYDVDRDGRVSVPDVLLTMKAVLAGSYTGRYDTDANGSLGRNDIVSVLKAAAAS